MAANHRLTYMNHASCAIAERAGAYRPACLRTSWNQNRVWVFLWALVLVGTSMNGRAVAPGNDLCSGAEVLLGSGPFPISSSITPDITDATTTGDPDPNGPSCLSFASRSIWYVFTPTETALYRVSVSGDTETTLEDTVMEIFTSEGGCAGPFTSVACNDDSGLHEASARLSAIAITLSAGTTYYVVVWLIGDYPPPPNLTAVQLRISKPIVPANDNCANAEIIPGEGAFPYLTDVTDNLLASQTAGEPLPSCREGVYAERSVWYRFTPTQTSFYSLSTCAGTDTTIYDTVLAIYTAPNGCAGPFVPVACNDNGCGLLSDIKATLMAGTTYYIAVYDTEEEAAVPETDVQLRVTIAPEAITLAASSITSTGAVVHGIVRPNGVLTRFWFEWGPNQNYGTRSPIRLLFGDVTEAMTNALVTPITPDLVYHYRMIATNSNGVTDGGDRTFLYSSNPPQLDDFAVPVNGGPLTFIFGGSASQLYRTEISTNLIDWVDAGPASEISPGSFIYSEDVPADVPARFYRVRSP